MQIRTYMLYNTGAGTWTCWLGSIQVHTQQFCNSFITLKGQSYEIIPQPSTRHLIWFQLREEIQKLEYQSVCEVFFCMLAHKLLKITNIFRYYRNFHK